MKASNRKAANIPAKTAWEAYRGTMRRETDCIVDWLMERGDKDSISNSFCIMMLALRCMAVELCENTPSKTEQALVEKLLFILRNGNKIQKEGVTFVLTRVRQRIENRQQREKPALKPAVTKAKAPSTDIGTSSKARTRAKGGLQK